MNAPSADDFYVRLAVDDARAAQGAGIAFARRLAGAASADFALALAEQELLVERTIIGAGYGAVQAELAAGHFGAAARAEWARITSTSGGGTWATT